MSLKRVVLIVAMLALVSPAVALADGITFGFMNGAFDVVRPFTIGSTGSTAISTTTGATRVSYVSRFSGSLPLGSPVPPTYGQIPNVNLPGTTANPFNFGTVSFTTGLLSSMSGDALSWAIFDSGGSISIISNANFATVTGGAVPSGTTMFSGAFSGPTTLTQVIGGTTCTAISANTCYTLTGPVNGILDAAFMSHFGLTGTPNAQGLVITLNLGFLNPTGGTGQLEAGLLSVVVPEPGTLALFGTGLIGVAGFIRRRIKG